MLVVDDHPLLREAIAARLRSMGAGVVHEAASVAEARARAQANGPCDLAILDLGLPDGSGLDLVTELRSLGWNRLVVLASSDDPYAVRSFAGPRCVASPGPAVGGRTAVVRCVASPPPIGSVVRGAWVGAVVSATGGPTTRHTPVADSSAGICMGSGA